MIGRELTEGLRELSRRQNGTLFMGIVASLKALFYRYTGQRDMIIGSPVAGRGDAELEDQIGFYINTLALRTRLEGEDSFESLLGKVREVTLSAYEHQMYPFDRLVEDLGLRRDMSRSALFDVMVVLHNQQQNNIGWNRERKREDEIVDNGPYAVKFDMSFDFVEDGDTINMYVQFNTDIYDKKDIHRLIEHYKRLLRKVISDPLISIGQIDYLSEEERWTQLKEFNNTEVSYPLDKTIVELFEEQVMRTPENTALIYEGGQLCYLELNERGNQLANYLRRNYDIHSDDLIAIKLDRSEWLIISILGVLKSGGAYVPIDPEYPEERINYLVKDSGCKVLMDEKELEKFRMAREGYDKGNLKRVNTADDLAYVIYTSGTTGNPKGVMIEHRNLCARISYYKAFYHLHSDDNFIFYRSHSFDGSIEEYLLPLMTGGKCFVTPVDFKRDLVNNIVNYTHDHNITKLNMPPALLRELVRLADAEILERISSLRHIVSGGDTLTAEVVEKYLSKFTVQLYNSYGPTENTIDSINWKVEKRDVMERVPIGRPIQNSHVYILDDYLNLVPIGVRGELYVGGAGLARGYLNRADLTAERFVADPFRAGGRLYRTGDLGRWLADGNIEYLGRGDDQVKIRGYRIELGEVEQAMRGLAGMDAVVVVARGSAGGDRTLVGYFTSAGEQSVAGIRSALLEQLPEYMVPGYFVQLERLPLTANGKVDKKALPSPEEAGLGSGRGYVAPRSEAERVLAGAYEVILKRAGVSVTDGFFELGGDSIKAILLTGELKRRGYGVKVGDILRYPVVEELAVRMGRVTRPVGQGAVEGAVPLTPIQRWFLGGRGNKTHFNQSVLLYSRERIDGGVIERCLELVSGHHDALRMVYGFGEGGWRQYNRGKGDGRGYEFEEHDLVGSADEPEEMGMISDRVQGSMDMGRDRC